jgi:hypothetical protein
LLRFWKKRGSHTVETITIAEKSIEPCRGCYCCWEKTPGVCVIADDMKAVFEKYLHADMIIWFWQKLAHVNEGIDLLTRGMEQLDGERGAAIPAVPLDRKERRGPTTI